MIKDIPFPDIGLFTVADNTDYMRQLEEGWCYETAIWKPFFGYFKPGVFIDVGACWGFWTCLSSLFGATHCYAVEPCQVNHRMLCKNISRLHIPVTVLPFFAGEKYGWAKTDRELDEIEHNYSISVQSSFTPTGNWVVPLDDFVIGNITGIKIDVEGYETAVVRGLMKKIEFYRPVITCEFHFTIVKTFGFDLTELPSKLLALGYTLHWISPELSPGFNDLGSFIQLGEEIQLENKISGQFIAIPKNIYG